MLKRTFLLFISVLAAGAVMAQAYRWVDENGVVHFSDRPVEGAERIILPETDPNRRRPTLSARSARSSAPQATTTEEPAETQAAFNYESLIINAPAAEETLWNIEGTLNVALDLRPALRPGDQVRVYFDGEPRMVSSTNFQIEEVWRGVHNLQAEVVDPTGRLMIRSLPNRFYVQQNTIAR